MLGVMSPMLIAFKFHNELYNQEADVYDMGGCSVYINQQHFLSHSQVVAVTHQSM
jgi:hypothetical protein